jgi:hypothetical protein
LGAGIQIEFRVAGRAWFGKGAPGIGLFKCGFIRHKERALERLVLGVTEVFGGLLGFGGALDIPWDGFGRFLGGF